MWGGGRVASGMPADSFESTRGWPCRRHGPRPSCSHPRRRMPSNWAAFIDVLTRPLIACRHASLSAHPPRAGAEHGRPPGAARHGDAAARAVRPGVYRDHGRGDGALASGVPDGERAHVPGLRRRGTVRSNYLDLGQLASYWSPARVNHRTAPTTMVYGLRAALSAVAEEGLPARFARHRLHGDALRAGVAALGLSLFGKEPPERRLPMLTPVLVPDGVDDGRVRRALLDDFGIEIGAAFGPLQGKVWRIGTMGYSARRQNVLLLLSALEQVLR